MISKGGLLDLLWGVVNENAEALKIRNVAAKKKDAYWKAGEWIYIKNTEVSLKMILKEIKKSELIFDGKISELILDGKGEDCFLESEWALAKIRECRANMKAISNPD